MHTLQQRALMNWKWCASFIARGWEFGHYPVWVRRNGVVEPEFAWLAQILGWPGLVGLGATPNEAREALRKHFAEIKAHRVLHGDSIPRPGTIEPIRFASSDRVNADSDLLRRFVEEVLEFTPGSPVFLSDGSSLHDFGAEDEVERLRGRIRGVFGVETVDLEDAVVADILDRIREQKHDG